MRFSQIYALISTVLATVLVSAMPAPQAAGAITGCSADGKSYTTASGTQPCAAGLVCNAALIPAGANPCDWPAAGAVTNPTSNSTGDSTTSAPVTLGSPKASRKAKDGKRLVIYWSVYDDVMKEPSAEELKGVTQFIFAFVDMKTMTTFINPIPDIKALKAKAAYKDILFTAAFGGWELDIDFRPNTLTDATRSAFADAMVKLVDTFGFDGVDLDWEYPGGNGAFYKTTRPDDPNEGKRFALFVETLRGKLGEDKTITLAVPVKPDDVAKAYDTTTVPYMDAFVDSWNVMSYDFLNRRDGSGVTGSHAGKKVMDDALTLWTGLGLDPSKINLGVPYYSKYFKVDGECTEAKPLGCKLAVMEAADGSDAGVGLSGAIRLDYTLNMPVFAPAQVSWDKVKAGTAKIFKDAEGGASAWYDASTHWFWSFLTAEDVTAACTYFKPKVGGMMSWALHQDGTGAPLQTALANCYATT